LQAQLAQTREFVGVLASHIYDQNIDLLTQLYDKVIFLQAQKGVSLLSEPFFNYVAWGAAHFQKHDLLSKVLYQAAVLDYPIDM